MIGRRSRFIKVIGLRVDLDRVETVLEERGISICCGGNDDELVIVIENVADEGAVRRLVAEQFGLPNGVVRICCLPELPRLATGKPDYGAVSELAEPDDRNVRPIDPGPADARMSEPVALQSLFAEVLERSDVSEDSTFVSLGGDSLSYAELSVRLEQALGYLPANWQSTPIGDLIPARPRRWTRGHAVETSVVLRAVAIVLIVGTHAKLFDVLGSAHVLVAVAGFNFARFQLTSAPRRERVRHQLTSLARIAIPSIAWILAALLITDQYGLVNVFLLNAVLGPETWTSAWHFWFVEVLVYLLLALVALMGIPWMDRAERRYPFGFVAVLLSLGLLSRFEVVDAGVLSTKPVFWLFALGWATARVTTTWQRVFLTAVILASVPGFFDDLPREAVMIGGLALLMWAPCLRLPAAMSRSVAVLASSSLFIYLTHWQVYPHLSENYPAIAVAASIGVGILYWMVATRAMTKLASVSARLRSPRMARMR
ncbi:hypothetical protein BH24ACT9_BH24ACT9_01590 [soil metagenome]